jgi:hypothetical protein
MRVETQAHVALQFIHHVEQKKNTFGSMYKQATDDSMSIIGATRQVLV